MNALLFAALLAWSPARAENVTPQYADYILSRSSRGGVDKDLLKAILNVSSRMPASPDAIGPMRLPASALPKTGMTREDLEWFNNSVGAASARLAELLKGGQPLEKALAEYGMGDSAFASRVLLEFRRLKGGADPLRSRMDQGSIGGLRDSLNGFPGAPQPGQGPGSVRGLKDGLGGLSSAFDGSGKPRPGGAVFLPAGSPNGEVVRIATRYAYTNMRYKRGGESEYASDCSGFVRLVMASAGVMDRDVFTYRSAAEQYRAAQEGVPLKSGYSFRALRDDEAPRPGDIAYFRAGRRINHTGVFLGYGENGCLKLAHSSAGGSQITCSEYHARVLAGFARVERR